MGLTVRSTACSHVGHVRARNEDSWLDRPDLGLWVVADGMGGHDSGDRASQMITGLLDKLEPPAGAQAFARAVDEAVQVCHRQLQDEAQPNQTIGTTFVSLLVFDGHCAVMWAGDSRCYRLAADGSFRQLSHDHSLVQELVDRGDILAEEAELHPMRGRITRALGVRGALRLDSVQARIEAGDRFLLCSDGLNGLVDDADIADTLAGQDIESVCEDLVDRALEAGGYDNVTAVIVEFPRADEETIPVRPRPD